MKDLSERRRLIYVPIVHESADMGSQAEKLRQIYVARYGLRAWQESRKAISAYWLRIEREIERLNLDYKKVRLYQDGLPVCGQEAEIIRDVAETGSRNYSLLQNLIRKGSFFEGTEDPALLCAERDLLNASDQPEAEKQANASKLMKQRDQFISDRIDQTLQPGEVGIVFIGALHKLREILPKDIEVRILLER